MTDLPDDADELLAHAEREMMIHASDTFEAAIDATKWMRYAADRLAQGLSTFRFNERDPYEAIEAARAPPEVSAAVVPQIVASATRPFYG